MPALTSADLFQLRFVRSARLSPDGETLAYAVSRIVGENEVVDTLVGPCDGAHDRVAVDGCESVAWPRWSPDGKRLAVVGDGRLYVIEAETLRASTALTAEDAVIADEPTWSPDGQRLAITLLRRLPSGSNRVISSPDFRADGLGFVDDIDQSIFEVEVSSGQVRRLAPPSLGICLKPKWSPTNDVVLFLATTDAVPYASYSPQLHSVNTQTDEIFLLLGNDAWYITDADWTPSGERVVVVGAHESTLPIPYTDVWTIDRNGGDISLRTSGVRAKPGMQIHHDMPCWDLTSNIMAVPSDDVAIVTFQDGGQSVMSRVSLNGPESSSSLFDCTASCIVLDAPTGSDRVLFAVTDIHSPPELSVVSLHDGRSRTLTKLNSSVLENWPDFSLRSFIARSDDGLELETWFLSLADVNEAMPTVLYIHGGPYAATGNAFRFDLLLLASRGLGVVFSNFRGSAGYGEAHARGIVGNWGDNGFPDHMAAIDRAIELGHVDPDRIGVWGASHGGFATLWLVTHSTRFKAAIAEASVANFASLYYLSDASESFAKEMGGPPHLVPEAYRSRSPLTFAARCSTPTLLLHGEDDLRCPIAEAEQFFRALNDVGCVTELVRLAGADHLGDSRGPVSARRGQNEALVRWFDTYL